MNALIRSAADLQAVCLAHDWKFCFIGGLAVQRWGQPRETVDVDLTLLTGFADEAAFVSTLLASFEPRVPDAAAFARINRAGLRLRSAQGSCPASVSGGPAFDWLKPSKATPYVVVLGASV